jgi:hypothetical protein
VNRARFRVEGDYGVAGLLRGKRLVGSEPMQVFRVMEIS